MNTTNCLKYTSTSVGAFCDASSTCVTDLAVCNGTATQIHFSCSPGMSALALVSSDSVIDPCFGGCARLCDQGATVATFPLSQVCWTDYQQHDCASGLVCGADGQCGAPPPVIPPVSVPPPLLAPSAALPPAASPSAAPTGNQAEPAAAPTSSGPPTAVPTALVPVLAPVVGVPAFAPARPPSTSPGSFMVVSFVSLAASVLFSVFY